MIHMTIFEKCGGVMKAESCGSLNKKQVSNFKSSKSASSIRDPLFAVIEQCKREESQ